MGRVAYRATPGSKIVLGDDEYVVGRLGFTEPFEAEDVEALRREVGESAIVDAEVVEQVEAEAESQEPHAEAVVKEGVQDASRREGAAGRGQVSDPPGEGK